MPAAFPRGWPPASPQEAHSSSNPSLLHRCRRRSATAVKESMEAARRGENWRSPAVSDIIRKIKHFGKEAGSSICLELGCQPAKSL